MKTIFENQPRRIVQRLEQRNREIWRDHSTFLEDITHVVGGVGIGLLLSPVLRKAKPVGWAMVLASTALHFYADTNKSRR